MTSKKSLFNFGIFKNTVKRLKWGSFLYAVILFFCVPFALMVQGIEKLEQNYRFYGGANTLIRDEWFILPFLLAICVPTVVAVLVYHFVHSQKQGIAVHSLPATRKENYFSSVLASFVLMGAPVVFNTLILILMSLLGYGKIFSLSCVAYWFFMNISILFIMFSVASFTAFLSGHPAAHIVINAFVHGIMPIIAFAIYLVCEKFLYGFRESDNFIANILLKNTPVVWFYNSAENYRFFKGPQTWIFFAFAILFYVLGYILYKKRKIETSGDVIAFKIFRPIFKYSFVSAVAVALFGIGIGTNLSLLPSVVLIGVFTLISYFAIEMLMKKSFRVFRLYKGYLGFLGALAVVTLFFSYTSVFGYETRIPDSNKIVKSGIYSYYDGVETPLVIDEKLAEEVRAIHKELTQNIPVTEDNTKGSRNLNVVYQLESGKIMKREYHVTEEQFHNCMERMFNSEKYKLKFTGIDNINIENVKKIDISTNLSDFSYDILLNDEEAQTFLKMLEKDIKTLDYNALEKDIYVSFFNVNLEYSSNDNKTLKIFKRDPYDNGDGASVLTFSVAVNSQYKNAFSYLKELGCCDEVAEKISENLYICKEPFTIKNVEKTENEVGNSYSFREVEVTMKNDVGNMDNFYVNPDDLVKLSDADAKKTAESLFYTKSKATQNGTYYGLFYHKPGYSDGNIWIHSNVYTYNEKELPEYLKSYLLR